MQKRPALSHAVLQVRLPFPPLPVKYAPGIFHSLGIFKHILFAYKDFDMRITICGSIAFYAEMERVKVDLEALGHEVAIPLLADEVPTEMGGGRKVYFGKYVEENGGTDAFPVGHALWDMKGSAIRAHYEKIDWCDAILVVNPEKRGMAGYIGGNTLIEIGVAFYQKKPIYIMNDISSELSYKQEILGMKPVFIEGSFECILDVS